MLTINFRYHRLKCDLKQKDIAYILNIAYQQYQKYEYGILKPNVKRLIQISKILRISAATVITALQLEYGIYNIHEAQDLYCKLIKEV